ncbi:MAG: helix-turn-helix domain-containing protein [Syntrophorhabdaceae bacterium]
MKYDDLPNKSLLTPDEVANFFSVAKSTVYKWCEVGELKSTNVGVLRIFRLSVIAMIEKGNAFSAPKSRRRAVSKGIKM